MPRAIQLKKQPDGPHVFLKGLKGLRTINFEELNMKLVLYIVNRHCQDVCKRDRERESLSRSYMVDWVKKKQFWTERTQANAH